MEIIYAIVFLAVVLLVLLYYIFMKEQEQERKMRVIASAAENVNRNMYNLEKRMLENITQIQDEIDALNNSSASQDLSKRLSTQLHAISEPLSDSLYDLEDNLERMQADYDKRISFLENAVRNLAMPSNVQSMDDEKIISLYQEGVSVESIAKELRLAPQDVNLVLKLNKIR